MPEGHTLHRLALDLSEAFAGSTVRVSSPQGRFAESAALVDGEVLTAASAWGKHLFLDLAPGGLELVDADDLEPEHHVHVHLGLYGKFAVHRGTEVAEPRGQVRMRLVRADHTAWADLRGATACELLTAEQRDAVVARQGPDPLRPGTDWTPAWERVRRSRAPVAGLLMDQTVLAGIGNVYRAEILFRHRVDPFRAGRTLRVSTFRAMWEDLVVLMTDGVRTGRIETVRPEDQAATRARRRTTQAAGGPTRRVPSASHYVYRHTGEPCVVCGATIRTQELAGRNLFWCPRCQPVFRSRAAR